MDMRRVTSIIAVSIVLAGLSSVGCTSLGPELGSSQSAITDGSEYSGHPAIGLLVTDIGGGYISLCTGTLIGSKTVLTAAHCVDGVKSLNKMTFHTNADLPNSKWGQQYSLASTVIHPDYGQLNTGAAINDIALLKLKTAPPVSPLPIAVRAPAAAGAITLIGYGNLTTNSGSGVKRIATNVIEVIDSMDYRISGTGNGTGNFCFGDSGGPTLANYGGTDYQVGIHSYVIDIAEPVQCGKYGVDMRVDVYAQWIKDSAGETVSAENFIDTQAPTVSITSPANGATVDTHVDVTVQASDDNSLASLELAVNGQWLYSSTDSAHTFSLIFGYGETATLQARATDSAGNVATTTAITVQTETKVDITPPLVAIASHSSNAVVEPDFTLEVGAIDETAVASVELAVNGEWLYTDTTLPYRFQPNLGYGQTYSMQARATDSAGNTALSTTIQIITTDAPDVTPPVVSISDPTAGASIEAQYSIQVAASDASGVASVELAIDGQWSPAVTVAPYGFSLSATPGTTVTLRARATDLKGNSATSTEITVQIKDVNPTTTPKPDASVPDALPTDRPGDDPADPDPTAEQPTTALPRGGCNISDNQPTGIGAFFAILFLLWLGHNQWQSIRVRTRDRRRPKRRS